MGVESGQSADQRPSIGRVRALAAGVTASIMLLCAAPLSAMAGSNGQQFEFIDGFVLNNAMKSFCVTGYNQNNTQVHGCWNSTGTYTVTRSWWWVGTVSLTWYSNGGSKNGPGNIGPIPRAQGPNCWSYEDDNGQQGPHSC